MSLYFFYHWVQRLNRSNCWFLSNLVIFSNLCLSLSHSPEKCVILSVFVDTILVLIIYWYVYINIKYFYHQVYGEKSEDMDSRWMVCWDFDQHKTLEVPGLTMLICVYMFLSLSLSPKIKRSLWEERYIDQTLVYHLFYCWLIYQVFLNLVLEFILSHNQIGMEKFRPYIYAWKIFFTIFWIRFWKIIKKMYLSFTEVIIGVLFILHYILVFMNR